MVKTVYFLGAGATIDVCPEAPSNKNLVEKALREFADKPEAEQVQNFIKDVFKNRQDLPIDNQVWNLLDYIIQQGKSPSIKYNLESIFKIRNNLLYLVINFINNALKDINHETCKKFISMLKDSETTIISTNYDIVIDNALVFYEDSYNYGPKIRYSITTKDIHNYRGFLRAKEQGGQSLNTGKIQLLKLHGSLNWLYCRKCDEVDLSGIEKGSIKALSGLYCANPNCTNSYEPLLITPTMFKSYENRFIKETWQQAEKALTETENLIFVGYALKDEDYHIRCLLMKALLNRQNKYNKIIAVERKPETEEDKKSSVEINKKYENLYGPVDFRPEGFTKHVETCTASVSENVVF